MLKKTSSFIALLLLATTFNTYNMEKQPELSAWEQIVGGILLGTTVIKMLWQPQQPFPFTDLPPEMQDKIIQLLSLNTTASTLKDAAFTINSLTQVNKELNEYINNSKFCLKLIKHLAKKFNCSDETAAKSLQTQAAKQRYLLQENLAFAVSQMSFCEYVYRSPLKDDTLLKSFKYKKAGRPILDLINEGADLNFIYNNVPYYDNNKGNANTLLMSVLILKRYATVMFLLDLGADPTIGTSDNRSSLQVALEKKAPEKIIDLIQNAIEKKYGKKYGKK